MGSTKTKDESRITRSRAHERENNRPGLALDMKVPGAYARLESGNARYRIVLDADSDPLDHPIEFSSHETMTHANGISREA